MRQIDRYGVILGDRTVDYADGSEGIVVETIAEAADRSDGSDELADRVVDWPTRYHFSPLRSNVLRPLRIEQGIRVLEIGCGTGPITRYLGEQGASVLAVEGSLERARGAALRCADLDSVEVLCGTLADVDAGGFDLVVVVGVLEYSGAMGEGEGPDQFLRRCVSLMNDDGVLVLAIENQLGLKYLIGHDEDHHGVPWIGVSDYPIEGGARTWSRKVLRGMLSDAGLTEQRWLYPFPDYKLPTTVIDQSAFDLDNGAELVDDLVMNPVTDDAGIAHVEIDARAAHAVFLRAGLGSDIANSFLVIASVRTAPIGAMLDDDARAWIFGASRPRKWRRNRRVASVGDRLEVVDDSAGSVTRSDWLAQHRTERREFVRGMPLDRSVGNALARNELDRARELLGMWRAAIDQVTEGREVDTNRDEVVSPFSPRPGEIPLPGSFFDITLDNFVVRDGACVYIDDEWRIDGLIGRDLAIFRALWWSLGSMLRQHLRVPFAPESTMVDVVRAVGRLADWEFDDELVERFIAAESELSSRVHVVDPALAEHDLRSMLERRVSDFSVAAGELRELEAKIAAERHALEASLASAESSAASARAEVEALHATKLFRWSSRLRQTYRSLHVRGNR